MEVRQDNAADGSDLRRYAPQVDIDLVSKRLKERRRFDAAARVLGNGAWRFNLAPAVEGCLRCLTASYSALFGPDGTRWGPPCPQ